MMPGILVRMKKAGWIATVATGVVLVGGGAWGATALAALPTGDSQIYIDNAAPEASATPEVTPTPTVEPTPTTTPEVVETPAPLVTEEPAPERDPRAAELQDILYGWGITTYSDAEVLTAADQVCSELASGTSVYDVTVLPDEGKAVDGQFVYFAKDSYC